MKYGLDAKHIQQIHDILKKYDAVDCAILYGSRAKGNYREGSDIDLTLQGENLNLNILHRIYNDFDDSPLPFKCDLSILHLIANADMRDHIGRVGIIFYQKNSVYL